MRDFMRHRPASSCNVSPVSEFGENSSRVLSATVNEVRKKTVSILEKPADSLTGCYKNSPSLFIDEVLNVKLKFFKSQFSGSIILNLENRYQIRQNNRLVFRRSIRKPIGLYFDNISQYLKSKKF